MVGVAVSAEELFEDELMGVGVAVEGQGGD